MKVVLNLTRIQTLGVSHTRQVSYHWYCQIQIPGNNNYLQYMLFHLQEYNVIIHYWTGKEMPPRATLSWLPCLCNRCMIPQTCKWTTYSSVLPNWPTYVWGSRASQCCVMSIALTWTDGSILSISCPGFPTNFETWGIRDLGNDMLLKDSHIVI